MDYWALIIAVLGGLAIFVYGMGLMSEGLTQVAGARMKAVLGYVTKNRFAAILAGAGVTAVIQSSSATTVMTVGFVNAGLLSLQQAIGVIFGANIGTTITGQIVAFKLDDLALPAIIAGVVGLMLAKRSVARGAWKTILGFGFLFFGMTLMSVELKALAKEAWFVDFFKLFDCTPIDGSMPMLSVFGAVAVGTLCTMVVQSSSATIGITIALANAGVINAWTAVPIVLGDNIGTTITAILASIGTNANARRTALAHALFNLIGTCLLLSTFEIEWADSRGVIAPAYFHLVNWVAPSLVMEQSGLFAGEGQAGRFVAMAHTLFNVTNVIVLFSFIPLLARLCQFIIKEEKNSRTLLLEPHLLATPEMALLATRVALADMARRAWTVSAASWASCFSKNDVAEESINRAEQEIDEMQAQMRDYLIQISQQKLSERQAQMIPELLHCVNDAERISDIAVKIYRKTDPIHRETLSEETTKATEDLISAVRNLSRETMNALKTGEAFSQEPREQKTQIYDLATEITKNEHNLAVIAVIAGLRDIARHVCNIAVRVPVLG